MNLFSCYFIYESSKAEIFRKQSINIITDLLNEGTYEDFINLQKNKTCNAHIIFLEQELQGFKKLELSQFDSTIFLVKVKLYLVLQIIVKM